MGLKIGKRTARTGILTLAILLLAGLVACSQPEETLPWSDDFADPESGWKTEADASAESMARQTR